LLTTINHLLVMSARQQAGLSHLVVKRWAIGMTLDEFEMKLVTLIGRPTNLRPFVCNGSPLACDVFVVGFNPATEMAGDFWDHWKAGLGFDKSAWFQAYLSDRWTRPLKPGKKSRPALSNTRRCLGWIEDGARGVSILETNVFAKASETKPELALKDRNAAPFRFLVDVVKPKVIVAHGADAHAAVDQLNTKAQVLKVPHLSRGWSEERAREFGRSLAAMPDNLSPP